MEASKEEKLLGKKHMLCNHKHFNIAFGVNPFFLRSEQEMKLKNSPEIRL